MLISLICQVTGQNIIAVLEGSNRDLPVMVVGADYATSMTGNHLQDNTGGVAILLETLSLFFHATAHGEYHLNATVIFVAFDLNTREMVSHLSVT